MTARRRRVSQFLDWLSVGNNKMLSNQGKNKQKQLIIKVTTGDYHRTSPCSECLCCPSKSAFVKISILQGMVLRGRAFGGGKKVMRAEPRWMGLVPTVKEAQGSLSALLPCGEGGRRHYLCGKKEALTRHQICWCLSAGLYKPQVVRNKSVFYKLPPSFTVCCFNFLNRPDTYWGLHNRRPCSDETNTALANSSSS